MMRAAAVNPMPPPPSQPPSGPPPPPQTGRCYFCGRVFPVSTLRRREEQISKTSGTSFNPYWGVSRSSSQSVGIVDVCPSCAVRSDADKAAAAEEHRKRMIVVGICIGGFFALILLMTLIALPFIIN